MKQAVTITAPAGSFESLAAAIQAGTDAVYFGIEQLNMRARSANNFTIEDLKTIAETCRRQGVSTYLTLNTILYDHDMALMKRIVDTAKASGVDAVIASDHAAIAYANKAGLSVHISTQVNITNAETVRFYSTFADVMVLSRELTLNQVKKITKAIQDEQITGPSGQPVQIEVFAHGALCMAVSGKCYLSLHTHNSSANRGACKQNCRRSYTVKDEEGNELLIDNEYIMSPKDLSTIAFLDQVMDAGVSVLKIEGRGRAPEYVLETVACYREAVQAVNEGTYTQEKIAHWDERLKSVYNRGFWDGYYLGRKLGEWADTDGSRAAKRKEYIGKGVKYFDKIQVAEFKLESGTLSVGDEILVTGPTTGVQYFDVHELRLDEKPVPQVSKGDNFSIPLPFEVRRSDKLFRVIPA